MREFRGDPDLQAALATWREGIATNLELVAKLRAEAVELSARRPPALAPIPRPANPAATFDRRVLPALARQEQDPSLANYPEAAVKLAARLGTRELGLTRPSEEELRRPGAASRMFRMHLWEAGPHNVAASRYAVVRAYMRALSSLAVERLQRKPRIPADFDEVTYLLANPDVAETVAAGGLASGYQHWAGWGEREHRPAYFRVPHQRSSPVRRVQPRPGVPDDFDDDAYLFFNPDLAEAVANGWFPSGYSHWSRFGRAEGRGGGAWEPGPVRYTTDSRALMESRPYGVNLYGFLSASTGLGSIARSCSQALESAGIPAHKIDIPEWRNADAQRRLPEFSPYRINLIQQNADMLPRFAQAYGTALFNGCYNIGYWLWELPAARPDWRHLYNYVDEIWVASDFCRQAFQQVTRLPVVVVPPVVEGLEAKAVHPREYFGFPDGVFVFGYIFDVSSYMDRKNPLCLIDAFKREFGDSREVLLCLKFYNSGNDEANVRALMEAIGEASNIRVIDRLMSENEIISLQNAFDCLVSPHRSEGFGYNLAESMYLAKPVIATRYSSNLDFMRDDNSYLIDCALTPIPRDIGPYRHGNVWADPSVTHLARLMRTVLEDPAGREEKGRLAAAEIRARYSSDAVGRVIAERFQKLGLTGQVLPATLTPDSATPYSAPPYSAPRPPRLFHPNTPWALAEEVRDWKWKPVMSVVTPVYNIAGGYLRSCIESVRAQHYPYWELCLCDDGSTNPETLEVLESYRGLDPRIKIIRLEENRGIAEASNRAAEISTGDYLAFLDNDDELAPEALYEVASAIHGNPEIDFLYTDEDKIDETGAYVDHYCKPDWSPEHLLSVNYVLHMLTVRKDLFYAAGQMRSEFSGAQDYDLALRLAKSAQAIHHVPKILYHWRKIAGSAAAEVDAKPAALDAGKRALEDYVQHHHPGASVEPGLLPGLFRARYPIPGNPLASLCILASGREAEVEGRGRVNLLANFVRSIVEKTEYPNYEIVVVDDGILPKATLRALEGLPYRQVSFPGPNRPFNFSKKVNFAWRQARGRYIVLLNDDMEVVSGEWLGAMLEQLQQDAVGVVGAKLLYPDERIQHVGMVLGVNHGAAHVYHGFPADFIGYNAFTHVVRNYSAVTAACMATRREVLEAAGGFEEQLAVDFNDVDFCLKAIHRGYRVVYTPYAELLHFEGASLPRTRQNQREVKLFRERWAAYVDGDPYYNPNLTREGVDYSI